MAGALRAWGVSRLVVCVEGMSGPVTDGCMAACRGTTCTRVGTVRSCLMQHAGHSVAYTNPVPPTHPPAAPGRSPPLPRTLPPRPRPGALRASSWFAHLPRERAAGLRPWRWAVTAADSWASASGSRDVTPTADDAGVLGNYLTRGLATSHPTLRRRGLASWGLQADVQGGQRRAGKPVRRPPASAHCRGTAGCYGSGTGGHVGQLIKANEPMRATTVRIPGFSDELLHWCVACHDLYGAGTKCAFY
jgi:hypothetical protein